MLPAAERCAEVECVERPAPAAFTFALTIPANALEESCQALQAAIPRRLLVNGVWVLLRARKEHGDDATLRVKDDLR